MSHLQTAEDSDPSLPRVVNPSMEEIEIPTLLTLRLANLARIGGKAHGIVVDLALGATLMVHKNADPRKPGNGSVIGKRTRASVELYKRVYGDLGFRLDLALERHRQETEWRGFRLESSRVDTDQLDFAMNESGRRVFVLPFCACPDGRLWTLWDQMDERHTSYADATQARDAFMVVAMAAVKAFTKHGPAEAGLTLDDASPLAMVFQADEKTCPTTPKIPFSKVNGGWAQSYCLWAPMVDSLVARREAKELSESLASKPTSALRAGRKSLRSL